MLLILKENNLSWEELLEELNKKEKSNIVKENSEKLKSFLKRIKILKEKKGENKRGGKKKK